MIGTVDIRNIIGAPVALVPTNPSTAPASRACRCNQHTSEYHVLMKKSFNRHALVMAFSSLLAAFTANAANSFYAPGDLVLFFQKEGSTNTVYANLGNAATLYRGTAAGSADGTNSIAFLNLNSTLTSAFGAGWASDTGLYSGLAANWGTSTTSTLLQDGDPHRTLYVSASRNSVGTVGSANSTGWDFTIAGNGAMTSGASGISQQNNVFENSYDAQTTISLTGTSGIDDQNPFLAPGLQGNAFNNSFGGGVQQQGQAGAFGTFGEAGQVEFALDLYRMLARNNVAGQVGGENRVGSYEGTVTIGTNGDISFIAVPEPSSLALAGLAAGSLVLRRRRNA